MTDYADICLILGRALTLQTHTISLKIRTPATNLRVRLGDYNLKGQTELYPHEEFTVRRKVVNENYNPATYQNDIALLELSEEVIYRQHIIPVCLPAKGDNFTGKTATVTGWGRTQVNRKALHLVHLLAFDLS